MDFSTSDDKTAHAAAGGFQLPADDDGTTAGGLKTWLHRAAPHTRRSRPGVADAAHGAPLRACRHAGRTASI